MIFYKKCVKFLFNEIVRPQCAGCRENRFFWKHFLLQAIFSFCHCLSNHFLFLLSCQFFSSPCIFFICPAFFLSSRIHQIFSHQFVTPILSSNCCQFEQLKNNPNFLWVKNSFFFSQFASWKRNQNKNTLKKLVNSDFKICETIICLQMKIPGIEKLIPEYGRALMMVTRPVKKIYFYRHKETFF